jgi:hypothetical protein
MNEIDHFKKFILYSDDVTADMYHMHSFKIGRLRWTLVEVGGGAITVAPELGRFRLPRSFLNGESVGRRRGI